MIAVQKQKQQQRKGTNMKTSILDQFASDAINAPETVTGGKGGNTRGRTRTGQGSSSVSLNKQTRNRSRTHDQ
jgi:hypothetical protein